MANLNEAYNGFGVILDKRKRCCGAQFMDQPNQFIYVNGKPVNIPQLKSVLERNKSLKMMKMSPQFPPWVELSLTKDEYRYVVNKLKKPSS